MATAAPLPHPGVRIPPPVFYVAGLAVGWVLHHWWPLRITGPESRIRMVVAGIFLAIGLVLALWALVTFRRARATVVTIRPAAALVTDGPYRYTRNPMYVSLAALYVGITLVVNSLWPLFLLPLVVLVIHQAVIVREERYLAGAFPTEYGAYCERVHRWL